MHTIMDNPMANEKMMPFIEHLVELRRRLIIVCIAVVIGMGIAWNLADDILVFIEQPLTGHTYLAGLKERLYREARTRFPAIYERFEMEKGTVQAAPADRRLNYTAPLEPFFMQCKISLIAGFIIALPLVFYQVWLFVVPGLRAGEKKLLLPFVATATVSFCVGALFFLVVIWPVIINFSLSYETEGLRSWFSLSAYVNFCLRLILVFGLIFELPVLVLLLSRFGLVTGAFLAKNRKYAVLACAIIAAFHADLITMFVIMVPMYIMYEISIWVAYLFGRKRLSDEGAKA
jgi:sec-independent protein translocase protein TatC